jgi:long-chain acyl-CoA synthetase
VEGTVSESARRGTGAETLAELTLALADFEGPALRWKEDGEWRDLSFADLVTAAREIAGGLLDLGVEAGDRVAILADTRPEWTLADLGAVLAGAVVVPVYHTASAEEAEHVLRDSGASAVFAENAERLEVARKGAAELDVRAFVVFEEADDEAIGLDALRERGRDHAREAVDERAGAVSPDDLFSIVYTSGTTGPPKGCRLSHRNLCFDMQALEEITDFDDEVVLYMFLPLAHVLSRMAQITTLDVGGTIAYWQRDKGKALEDLREIAPTHFPAVPRIFEKIWEEARKKAGGGLQGKVFEKAVEVGEKVREDERAGESPGPLKRAGHELADRQVLSKVRELFGGRLQFALTGAAPVATEMLEFFDACGVLILEGYGATETSAVATVNSPRDYRFGTVGKAVPGTEVRIADDRDDEGRGEILIRGPHVFGGYHGLDEETADVLDDDGWFHTGDLGTIDDGFLSVTGRAKEIIVTSSGKNITPTEIEGKVAQGEGISQVVVVGDERPYLVALIELDDDDPDPDSDDARERVQKAVDAANAQVARIEQIKKFAILPRPLSQEEGELTPTMKIKRPQVAEHFADTIDALYDEG